ncbi:aspartate 1-decarboxylase [Helicobacter sp. faydin-H20]|uniref:aspartate 1-decarboxylase n=1 Tax=Helicobacter anatolicus TaxID=2905874 RepID=UPI001E2A1C49|nr:aspartate 1-decarboxylase [Helicobacter anatolicus]MCE3036242.1 aspartate 1-decarboxylase [Helicobacter anatolicus]
MQVEMLYSKIHRARVSDANLNYVGSITIDRELADAAGLLEGMKVEILNVNNGERFATYVIIGQKKGEICLNGAAARKVAIGDVVIIVAYASYDFKELKDYKPKIVLVDENNAISAIHHEI